MRNLVELPCVFESMGGMIPLKKKLSLLLVLLLLFLSAYTAGFIWIRNGVQKIMTIGMQTDINFAPYMNEQAYDKLNPLKRGLVQSPYRYEPNKHEIISIVPVHYFFGAAVYAKQCFSFQAGDHRFGSVESIKMRVRWRNGHWYAEKVEIKP
ncbi:hypothetical protein [Paenibacillus sp. D51F]